MKPHFKSFLLKSCLVAGCIGGVSTPVFASGLKMSSPWSCPGKDGVGCSRWYEVYEVEDAAACESLSVTESCGRWYSADAVFTPPRDERKSIRPTHRRQSQRPSRL